MEQLVPGPLSWTEVPIRQFQFDPMHLDVGLSLSCGQAFRWHLSPGGWWEGVAWRRVLRIRQEGSTVSFQLVGGGGDEFVRSYFRLDVDLESVCWQFRRADQHVASAVATFLGLRVLCQEPAEALFSFICSTANSVGRISESVETLAAGWGAPLGFIDGRTYYGFPDAQTLAAAGVTALAQVGSLRWRGANLQRATRWVSSQGLGWLDSLRWLPYREARSLLMQIPGVGPKIADCVCLFGFQMDEAVPVDRHMWAIARQLFGESVNSRSMTRANYERVAELYRGRYGAHAGWVHQYLYHQRRKELGRA